MCLEVRELSARGLGRHNHCVTRQARTARARLSKSVAETRGSRGVHRNEPVDLPSRAVSIGACCDGAAVRLRLGL